MNVIRKTINFGLLLALFFIFSGVVSAKILTAEEVSVEFNNLTSVGNIRSSVDATNKKINFTKDGKVFESFSYTNDYILYDASKPTTKEKGEHVQDVFDAYRGIVSSIIKLSNGTHYSQGTYEETGVELTMDDFEFTYTDEPIVTYETQPDGSVVQTTTTYEGQMGGSYIKHFKMSLDTTKFDGSTNYSLFFKDVTDKFNSLASVQELKNGGMNVVASYDNTHIYIKYTKDGVEKTITYTLNGNVLSVDIPQTDSEIGSLLTKYLLDAIITFYGYNIGDFDPIITSGLINTYTLEQDGMIFKTNSDNSFSFKIDFTKPLALKDVSSYYLTTEEINKYISNQSFIINYGNMFLKRNGSTYIIGEKGELTDTTYESIISLIRAIFNNEDVVNYFKANYPSLSVGNKEFAGFKIEIDPQIEGYEEYYKKGYRFVRLTINIEEALRAMGLYGSTPIVPTNTVDKTTNSSSTSNNNSTSSAHTNSYSNPETGAFLNCLIAIIFVGGSAFIIHKLRRNKWIYKL